VKTVRKWSDDAAIDALRRELLQSLRLRRHEFCGGQAQRGDRRAVQERTREASVRGLQYFRELLGGREPR
jgi:hypothetical protein